MKTIAAWLALGGLAWLSFQQSRTWQSDLALWREAVRVTDSPTAWVNYGQALQMLDQDVAAEAAYHTAFDKATAVRDRRVEAVVMTNLAVLERAVGHCARAQAYIGQLEEQFPLFHDADGIRAWVHACVSSD